MKDRITIEGRNGEFGAYVARPKIVPAPAVVLLHEVFGVNADIRKTCDELAEQGFIAVAPDLFWRQEPGIALSVALELGQRPGGPECLLAERVDSSDIPLSFSRSARRAAESAVAS